MTLEVTPDVPHVFVGFAGMLDEADQALANAGHFIRANLASLHKPTTTGAALTTKLQPAGVLKRWVLAGVSAKS